MTRKSLNSLTFVTFCVIGTILFVSCGRSSQSAKSAAPVSGPTFENQLAVFQKLGFRLNEGVKLDDFKAFGTEDDFRDQPNELLYTALCSEIQREPWTPVTNRCWDFDAEAVEDEQVYNRIMTNLQRITRGEIVFEEVKSKIDFETEKGSIEFKVKDQKYNWDIVVDGAWVDPTFISRIVNLTRELETKGRFTEFPTDGENMIIGFETPEELKALNQKTGLKLVWLK